MYMYENDSVDTYQSNEYVFSEAKNEYIFWKYVSVDGP